MPQIIAPVIAFAATPLGEAVISIGISIGASLLSSVFAAPTPDVAANQVGVTLNAQIGGNVPIQFPLGWTATAGLLAYPGTWGNSGDTPNADAVWESVISFLPCPNKPVPWLNSQKYTVDWSATPTAQGYPLLEARVGGVDNAWLQYDDGTQTTVSSYMQGKFGSHPTRPYGAAMVGHGLAKVRLTLLANRDLWSGGQPDVLFETTGIKLYNVAKDGSVGGSGSHRWADPSTWEVSNNPIVQAYNVRRGIFYYPDPSSRTGAQWVYGGNNRRELSAYRLPASNWIAAINACDMLVALVGGGTEPQFRAGGIVTGDMQPVDVETQLLGACTGRMAEVGGIYEVLVGAPGAAVYAFTDANIVTTDPQSLDPFPGLENTYNAIEATYPEPAEKWATKDAPGRYNQAWEDADGGRQLVASAAYPVVPYATQVQRLMQTVANDNRQFRNHQLTLPPDAYGVVKPNRVVSWTSTRNGYVDKLFLVTSVTGKRGYNQVVGLREIDPADYDWDPDTQTLPTSVGTLQFERPAPQLMSGWTAVPASFDDDDGTARHPSIAVGCAGELQDVRAVRVLARLTSSGAIVFDGEVPYDPTVVSPSWTLNGSFLADTAYQVRGKLLPFSGRITRWSNEDEDGTEGAWLDVTTPTVVNADITDVLLAQLGQDTIDYLAWTGALARSDRGSLIDAAIQQASQDFSNLSDFQSLQRGIVSSQGQMRAEFAEAILVATGPDSAFAEAITSLYVAMGGDSSGVNIRYSSSYTPAAGFDARYGLEVYSDVGSAFKAAGIFFDVSSAGAKTIIVGDEVAIAKSDGTVYAFWNSDGEVINGVLRGPSASNFWDLGGGSAPGDLMVSNL